MKPTDQTVTTPPMGFMQRLKTAATTVMTGKPPTDNPLAQEPKDQARAALVLELNKWCIEHREFWRPVFDRMREEMRFAAGKQWSESYQPRTGLKEPYVGDVIQQMVNRQTASLYAKNPVPEAVMADRLEFSVWDGNQSDIDAANAIMAQAAPVLQQASQLSAQGAQVPAPPAQVTEAMDLLADYHNGMAKKKMYKRIADTGSKLLAQQWRAQTPSMIVSGKQAVAQVEVSRVAYIKVMYRREMEAAPTTTANDMNFSERLATLQQQLAVLEQDETGDDDAKVAEAKLLKASIQEQVAELEAQQPPPVVGDEGIIHDWLGSTAVLVDRNCTNLLDFVGAKRIAHEMFMTVDEAEAKYKINLKDSGAKYYDNSQGSYVQSEPETFESNQQVIAAKKYKVCVLEIQDKTTGLCYVIIDGVKDFVKEPETQDQFNRFWTIVPIRFNLQVVEENDPESDCTIFSRSQVRLAMPMQQDMNTAGEGLREHRVANRPGFAGVKSKFASTGGVNDLTKLAQPRSGFDVLMLENLMAGEKISDFIQLLPTAEIDPKMYDNAASTQAMMLATGEQPSDIGAQRPDEKATGQNIAAQARATSVGSNIDDLDLAYSTMAQMDWELLIENMDSATVKALVGPGAVWPDVNREDAARAIFFTIEAGSTGRPNEQADLNNFKVIAPQLGELMTASGRSLEPLIKEGVRRMGDKLDVDEFLKPAQVQMPPQPQPEPKKPPSLALTMNFKDLTPEEQDQAVQQYGIKPGPPASRLLKSVGHDKAIEATHHNNVLEAGGNPEQPKPTKPTIK